MGQLDGHVALVTGGESGIGAACAIALAREGAAVAITFHVDAEAAGQVCQQMRRAGARALAIKCDVGDEAQVEAAFAEIADTLGQASVLVNSAGVNTLAAAVADMDLLRWEQTIRTDLTGAFLTSRALARGLKAANRPGRIINISSIHSTAVRAGGADYCAAKAGLENLTRTMALECAPFGLTVNAIAPGMILTPLNKEAVANEAVRREREQHIPAKRAGQPEEVAAMALYFASDQASYVTGAVLTIDGGLSLVQAPGA